MRCARCGAFNHETNRFCHECGANLAAQLRQGPPVPSTKTIRVSHPRKGWVTLLLSCLFLISLLVWQVIGLLAANISGLDSNLCITSMSAIGAVIGVVALGGVHMLKANAKKLAIAWKRGWWVVAVSFVLFMHEMVSFFYGEPISIEEGWELRLLQTAFLLLCVGIHEEASFRGILLCGLLDAFGEKKSGIVASVVICSIWFGLMHVIGGPFDPTSLLDWMQALLKTVQTGMFGFFLAALVLDTGNLWGPISLHSTSNFLLLLTTTVFEGAEVEPEYVASSPSVAASMVILYSIVILMYLPLVWKGIRMLGGIRAPQHGAFHKEESKSQEGALLTPDQVSQ